MRVQEPPLNAHRERWSTALRRSEFAEMFSLPQQPLWRRAARAAAWVFALRVLEKGLALIRTVVLARLLLPRGFGLFAIVLIAVSALELVNLNGLRAALIQKHDDSRRDLDTVWSVLFIQNCLNAALFLIFAQPIAQFFGEPAAAGLIRAFSIALLLEALVSIGTIHFEKRMLLHRQFTFVLSGAAIDFVVAIAVAIAYRTVWALVAGAIAGRLARLLASYMLQDYRPALRIKWHSFRHLFRFEGWMWVSAALWFLLLQGDNIFVGKVFGITALGVYTVAYSIASITRTDIVAVLQRLMFPSFSSILSDQAQLRAGYLKLLRGTALCVVPVSVGLAALASEVSTVLLGPGWGTAGPVLSVLALLGALQILAANAGTLLRAMGHPRQATLSEVIFVIVSAALLIPLASKLHLVGVAWAMTIGAAAGWAWAERAVLRVLNISFRELLHTFESSVAAALVMLASLYLFRGVFPQVNWVSLATTIAGSGLMYLATVAVAALSRQRTLKPDAAAN